MKLPTATAWSVLGPNGCFLEDECGFPVLCATRREAEEILAGDEVPVRVEIRLVKKAKRRAKRP